MDLLGVKYILDRPENPKDNTTFEAKRFKPIITLENQYTIFENKLVYPRAFLAGEYKTYDSIESFEEQFFSATFDPRQIILLPDTVENIHITKTTNATASIISYKPEEIIIKTESDAPQLLFLSDTYTPGWIASVDEVNTYVYRADYAFRAVVVQEGSHTVRFEYKPFSVTVGKLGTVLGLFLLLVLFFFKRKK